MRSTRHGHLIDRRGFLSNVTLAGAAALAPQAARAQAAESAPPVRLAQADTGEASSARAITVKSVDRLAGSADDPAAVRAALVKEGINPLIAGAFREFR